MAKKVVQSSLHSSHKAILHSLKNKDKIWYNISLVFPVRLSDTKPYFK